MTCDVSQTNNAPAYVLQGVLGDMKVFLVEDSQAVRERLIEMLLEVEGIELVGAADGYAAALSGIAATAPDVAVLDISLPDGNGIDVLVEAKRTQPDIRGIVLTNYATPQHRKASAEAGAEHFLDKSVDFERIPEILREMLKSGGLR